MADEPEAPRPDVEDEEEGGPVKSFLEHLEDLRWVIIKTLSALIVGVAVCMAAAPTLVKILKYPLINSGAKVDLNFFGPLGGVIVSMKIALYGGITLSLPFILYFIGEFVMPALKRNEKKYFLRAFIIGAGLFLLGVMLCYFWVLEISLKGMTVYNEWLGVPTEIWRAEEYFQFVTVFMVGMGISFEFPLVLLTLVRLGLISHEWMVKGRRYFFIVNLVVCSFITPDFVSTFFMIIPVQILLEICIWISAYWERQKKREQARLDAGDAGSGTA